MALTPAELRRYDRQMMIDGFGQAGQERLKSSQVAVAGVGGLGTAASLYLAAAGVGRLVLLDSDEVELSNLNRQILHWTDDVDRPKVSSAAAKLERLNPEIEIRPSKERITASSAAGMIAGCDLVVDAMDNFATRRLLSRACVEWGVPFIYGGVNGLIGMTTTMIPGRTACLDCLFPNDPPSDVFPVLGTTPGIIACLQATEAVKYLVGLGQLLTDRLLIYNGLDMDFKVVNISRNPSCPVCGKKDQA